jgi:2C-methyl-D-erythritol 2,4-cyclodiphosphate synthase
MAITQYQTQLNEIIEVLADGKITMEEACSLFKELNDELDADDQLKAFQEAISFAKKELEVGSSRNKERLDVLKQHADGKITMEEACALFKERTYELDNDKLNALWDAADFAKKELAQTKAESAAGGMMDV